VGLALTAAMRARPQPLVEYALPQELTVITTPTIDPNKNPEKRFSIVLVQVFDFALPSLFREEVHRHIESMINRGQ
jgi:hypothetical protein